MSEIFTPKAKSAMVLAAREAILFKPQAVGTEHLLLGLILLKSSHSQDTAQTVSKWIRT